MALAQAPGPELFAKEPRTPLELWEAADYLIRTGQANKAVPYLERFEKSQPDDATWVAIRGRYGLGSVLRLDANPATRPYAQRAADALAAAVRRYTTRPDRIARFVAELTGTPEEQDYAVRHLQEAGPYAVPFLVEALRRPGLSTRERELLVHNIGRLDRSAVPALLAVLDSSEPALVADAATALGQIRAPEAEPYLTFLAASAGTAPRVRAAASGAVARIVSQPFAASPRTPVQVLTAAAWSHHRERPEFPEEPVTIWEWDGKKNVPVPRDVTRAEANSILGLRFARDALRLDPGDRSAQVAQLSLALERATRQVHPEAVPAQTPDVFAVATSAGPSVLSEVLETAVADGKADLAAVAALAVAKVTHRADLPAAGRPHPLVRALAAPGRRTQFIAARALVDLAPDRPFSGSSLVVPALARFINNQPLSRAIVIDSNPNRGGRIAGFLRDLGYHPELEPTGSDGFRAAVLTADIELVLVSFDLFEGSWRLTDTLANLQADARTAGLPLFVYGPYDLRIKRPNLERGFPGIRYLVPPLDAATLERELKPLPRALPAEERARYAREAVTLLDRIARNGRSPMAADLRAVEPELTAALNSPETVQAAASALSELPDPDAQRSLLDLVLDPSRPANLRRSAADRVVHSIQRFKPLITARQEARLVATLDQEADPGVRAGLASIIKVLKPAAS
jgi:HEAT repeat protein